MRKHTKHSLVAALCLFHERHGRSPTVSDTVTDKHLPRYGVFEYHFGSWSGAIKAAGLSLFDRASTGLKLNCSTCHAPISVKLSSFSRSKTKRFFCSRSCSAKTNNALRKPPTPETKQKIRKTLRNLHPNIKSFTSVKRRWEDTIAGPYTRIFLCTCKYTNLTFYSPRKLKTHPTKFDSIQHYRRLCTFDFSLSKFPDWFDLTIIERLGMYKASNRGNNLAGASRDHMLSVSDAYRLGINPSLIKHPANCRIVSHPDNQRKNYKSCITLEELNRRICEFETMYPNWSAR